MVEEQKFRQDLYYRLNVITITLPPLRDRGGDAVLLARHFIDEYNALFGKNIKGLTPDAERLIAVYRWPGNVRELKNLVERLCLTSGETITAAGVRAVIGGKKDRRLFTQAQLRGRPLAELQAELHREYLLQLHADCGGDLRSMARALSITLPALYKRFRSLRLQPGELR
jgi:transcriptional regulator with PAS, ATPase and Fis domain